MRLIVHNYGILEDFSAELRPGLTVLTGVNGSGKSTTVDALFFALTGESLDGRNLVELINWHAMDGKAVVTLSCDEFSVTRTIKTSGVSHKLTVGEAVFTKRTDVNGWLFDHFKIDNSEVIKEVFISAQLHATDLFDTTNSNRLSMLSKVFGLEKIEQCRATIYKVLSETMRPTVDAEILAKTQERVALASTQLEQAGEKLKAAKEELNELNFDADKYNQVRAAPLDTERAVRQKALDDARASELSISDELEASQQLLDNIQLLQRFSDAQSMEREIAEGEKAIAEFDKGVAIEDLNTALRAASIQEADLQSEITKLEQQDVEQLTTCPLTGGTPCLDLLRLHDPETIHRMLKGKRDALAAVSEDRQQIQSLITDRTGQSVHIQLVKATVETSKRNLAALELPQDYLDQLEKLKSQLPEDREAIAAKHKQLTDVHQRNIAVMEDNRKWLEEHADDETVSPEEKQYWEDQKSQYNRLLAEATQLKNEYELKKNFLRESTDTLNQLLASKAEAEAFQRRADNLVDVRELMSRNQLQRALLRTTLSRINREIETCSRLFAFRFRIFIEDSGAILFQTDASAPKEVKFLSGGQKYVAAIITRIAFARVLNTRFNFMVLDEPSICLDDGSRELLAEFMGALNSRFKLDSKYLIVPTHDELILTKGIQVKMEEQNA